MAFLRSTTTASSRQTSTETPHSCSTTPPIFSVIIWLRSSTPILDPSFSCSKTSQFFSARETVTLRILRFSTSESTVMYAVFFFYYVCKYRKLIDGQKCSYKIQPPEKAVNAEVIAIIRQAMKSPDLVRLMRDYTNVQTDGAELQKRLDEVEKTRRQKVTMKDRISVDLDSIDLSDETAEMEYEDLKARQKKIYEEIIVIDREIRDIKGNMKHQADSKATLKTARRLMEEAGEKLLADDIEDIGKKLMLQCMI